MSAFDFKQPIQPNKYFEEYVRSKEQHIKSKLYRQPPQNAHLWAIVFVLMVSMVGLGVFALLQKQEMDRYLAGLNPNPSVAGISDSNQIGKNIITAEGFSLVLNTQTPEAFQLNRESGQFQPLEGQTAVTTSLLAKTNQDNQELLSGIQVSVIEYDNKLDRKTYDQAILKYLGQEYEIKGENISIPSEFQLSKIQHKTNPDGVAYYTSVTLDNYYLIKVYNQTAKYPELTPITRFTDSLLEGLYLN